MRTRTGLGLVLSLATLSGGCFPTNPKARTIAKLSEGGAIIAGIALLAVVNTSADCMTMIPGMPDTSCQDNANLASGIGLGLILGGLIGFIATVSTSPEDKSDDDKQPVEVMVAPAPPIAPTLAPTSAPTEPPAAPTEPTPETSAPVPAPAS